ncbi:hypothetical protein ACFX2H_026551 [Malus domestica]
MQNCERVAIANTVGREEGFHLGSQSNNTFDDHEWGFKTLSTDDEDQKMEKLELNLSMHDGNVNCIELVCFRFSKILKSKN